MKTPIIEYQKFKNLPKESCILIEAGSDLEAYQSEHLENALYVDLDKDLAAHPQYARKGGRHPLPNVSDFIDKLNTLGIQRESHVIIYDRNFGANSAARFWWMLTALEVENVQVLNGGFQYAKQQGFSTTDIIHKVESTKSDFPKEWQHPTIEIEEVKNKISTKEITILDVRAPERYQGLTEPIDPVAGHIPTAENIFFKENLDEEGLFKSPEEIRKIYQNLVDSSGNLVVYCGSGVTACHTMLSMVYAGLPMPKLYVGSWSEWCRN